MAAALNLVSLGSKLRDVALDRIAKATVKTQDLKREAQNSFQNNDFLGAIGHDIDEKISPRSVFKKGLVEIKIFFFFVKDHGSGIIDIGSNAKVWKFSRVATTFRSWLLSFQTAKASPCPHHQLAATLETLYGKGELFYFIKWILVPWHDHDHARAPRSKLLVGSLDLGALA